MRAVAGSTVKYACELNDNQGDYMALNSVDMSCYNEGEYALAEKGDKLNKKITTDAITSKKTQ